MRMFNLDLMRNFQGVALIVFCTFINVMAPALADPPSPRPTDPKSFYGIPKKNLEGNQLPEVSSPFPSYSSTKSASVRVREQRNKTVWSAPTPQEQGMLQAVTDSQLQQGADDPRTLNLMWRTAQYFLKVQKIQQAEPLLKELIATVETHAQKTENAQILSEAKLKLKEIQDARRPAVSPFQGFPRYMPPAFTPRTGMRGGNATNNQGGIKGSGNAQYVDPRNP